VRARALILILALLAVAVPTLGSTALAKPAPPATVRAGVGVVDATWNVGASAGQYASDRSEVPGEDDLGSLQDGEAPDVDPTQLLEGEHDPNLHSTKRASSYGVESRLTVRAIVVEGSDGQRVALLKSDNYLAQDLLLRRVGQLLADPQNPSGVRYGNILYHATHNHSSPYYTTPAAGVWLFQDVMDLRMFEYQARQMATAIRRAEASMVPVRMSATTVPFDGTQRNAPGGAVADDGSPSGYPQYENDSGLVVVRFDDITNRAKPKPLAVWMNYGVHPESLDGYDLITADYVGKLERFVGRATGVPLVFSQGGVGSSEPANDTNARLEGGVVRAFSHQGYAQAERHGRLMADKVIEGFQRIGAGQGDVAWSSDFPVRMIDWWVPGPVSHPYPAVSNCRSEPTVEGNPGAPILGLPDCARAGDSDDNASPVMENLKLHGLPVPEHYDAPAFGAVEENVRIHLQAVRLGEVLLASCSCEPQVDLIKNFESRTNDRTGDIYDGFDWADYCDPAGDGWSCADPGKRDLTDRSLAVTDAAYQRMVAQVHNDAKGWESVENAATANAEPADPAQIKGNFTKEELTGYGYKLPVAIGHGGDYVGYTVSYRMFMSFDHYRKALTSYGPHTADYMVTRMVRMAARLKGGPAPGPEPLEGVAEADEARQEALAVAMGQASSQAYDTWLATLPDDAGTPAVLAEPAPEVSRFSAATFSWRGGNNDVDNPVVAVERLDKTRWLPYADQTGEIQTAVEFPRGVPAQLAYRTGQQEWKWTATFEAADFFPRSVATGGQVPAGTYRFVVRGMHRAGGATHSYSLTSAPFRVVRWEGIEVRDLRVDPATGAVSFTTSTDYPRTYQSPLRFIGDDNGSPICKTCSFRAWASRIDVDRATVTVRRANRTVETVPAALVDGRWVAPTNLRPGDRAFVNRGGIVDSYGEINGAAVSIAA
jgi:hypothetical protein